MYDTGGGTWNSSNASTASVGSATGVVTGVAVGSATITYTLPTGCKITLPMTVNPLPSTITGVTNICSGATTILSDSMAGGAWSSSDLSVAYIDSGGAVTGITGGAATITYTSPGGCFTTAAMTVNPAPLSISGGPAVCVSSTALLYDVGGTWSSSADTVAAIDFATGIVTGVSDGFVLITYTLPTGCYTTMPLTVNPLPLAIAGTSGICLGLTGTLVGPDRRRHMEQQ